MCILLASVSCPPKKGFLYARGPFKTVFTVFINIFTYYNVAIYFMVFLNHSNGIVTRHWLDGLGLEFRLGREFQYT